MRLPIRRAGLHRALLAAAVLLVVEACGPTTLDPSSLEELQRSLANLREPMTPEERSRFEEAIGYLTCGVSPADAVGDPERGELVLSRFRPIAGRTAEGIVAEARFQRIREVRSAVLWLESWRDEAEAAHRELEKFRLSAARVFKRHRKFLDWPVIEIRVTNGTDQVVSLAHFRAALLAGGDESPWLLEEFDHVVLGGLAPGEDQVWRIEPKQQEWIRLIDPHPRLRFGLEVLRLESLGGREIASTDWGEVERHQLAIYRRTLEVIRRSGTLALDLPPRSAAPEESLGPVEAAQPGGSEEGRGPA
jgi:hypothetical protein